MVDYLIPIARAYRARVRLFQAQLHRDESKFKKEQMRLVLGMKSELQRLQRRIRPMTAVVRHLMDDEQIGTEMKVRVGRRSGVVFWLADRTERCRAPNLFPFTHD